LEQCHRITPLYRGTCCCGLRACARPPSCFPCSCARQSAVPVSKACVSEHRCTRVGRSVSDVVMLKTVTEQGCAPCRACLRLPPGAPAGTLRRPRARRRTRPPARAPPEPRSAPSPAQTLNGSAWPAAPGSARALARARLGRARRSHARRRQAWRPAARRRRRGPRRARRARRAGRRRRRRRAGGAPAAPAPRRPGPPAATPASAGPRAAASGARRSGTATRCAPARLRSPRAPSSRAHRPQSLLTQGPLQHGALSSNTGVSGDELAARARPPQRTGRQAAGQVSALAWHASRAGSPVIAGLQTATLLWLTHGHALCMPSMRRALLLWIRHVRSAWPALSSTNATLCRPRRLAAVRATAAQAPHRGSFTVW